MEDDMCVAEAMSILADDIREVAMIMTTMAAQICEIKCGDEDEECTKNQT